MVFGLACIGLNAQGGGEPDLFAADRVLDVQITIAKRDWNSLRMQSRSFEKALSAARKEGEFDKPYTYFDADVVIDGVQLEGVGVRKKGFLGSQSGTRPSLKIKLNHTAVSYTHLTLPTIYSV